MTKTDPPDTATAQANATATEPTATAQALQTSAVKPATGLPVWLTALVWLTRALTGATFIFSGWAKAVDPWGTVFKLDDYFAVWGLSVSNELTLIGACLLAAFEFTLGVLLLTGSFKRLAVWLGIAMMAVMLPLTVWIYATDPVSDCGCFGEALVLSNGATLLKNIVLTALLVFLVIFNRRVPSAVNPRLQWLLVVCGVIYCGVMSVYGYLVQPWVDFRDYPIGSTLSDSSVTSGATLVYAKDGVERSFSADSLPGDDWEFVRRGTAEATPSGRQLAIFDEFGDDVTADLAEESSNGLVILTVSNPLAHGISRSRMANNIYHYITERGGTMVAVIADEDPQEWATRVGAEFPVYSADDTDLKAFARGNAALVYVVDDIIRWKYALSALPPDMCAPGNSRPDINVLDRVRPAEHSPFMSFVSGLFAVIVCLLMLVSLFPALFTRFRRLGNLQKFS